SYTSTPNNYLPWKKAVPGVPCGTGRGTRAEVFRYAYRDGYRRSEGIQGVRVVSRAARRRATSSRTVARASFSAALGVSGRVALVAAAAASAAARRRAARSA